MLKFKIIEETKILFETNLKTLINLTNIEQNLQDNVEQYN